MKEIRLITIFLHKALLILFDALWTMSQVACDPNTSNKQSKIHLLSQRYKAQWLLVPCESPLAFQLMSGFTKIDKQSFFRSMKRFFFSSCKKKQLWCLFSLTRAIKAVFLNTCWGLINGLEPVLMGRCKFSPSFNLKRKARLLPSWWLHYYLSVPPYSGMIRHRSQDASPQQPPLGWCTAHNDGYTEDHITQWRAR